MVISGVDVDSLFPGLEFRSQGANERIFANPGEHTPVVIQVFGHAIFPDGLEIYAPIHQDIVATLRGKDCELYKLLGWQDKFRNHPDVGMGRLFSYIFLWFVCFIVNLLLFAFFARNTEFVHHTATTLLILGAFAVSFMLSFVETWLIFDVPRMFRRRRAGFKIDQWLARRSVEKSEAEIKALLSGLSCANDKDVAHEAKNALMRRS